MDCINTYLDIEKEIIVCGANNKKCNFTEHQEFCLYYESENKFMEDLEGEE